jgi:diadenylate cyclase
MSEGSKFDREFLRSALSLAARNEVDHFLYISDVRPGRS